MTMNYMNVCHVPVCRLDLGQSIELAQGSDVA